MSEFLEEHLYSRIQLVSCLRKLTSIPKKHSVIVKFDVSCTICTYTFTFFVFITLKYFVLITVAGASTLLSSPCSTVTVNFLPQRPSITPVITSPSMECSQQDILSQPTSCVTIVSNAHTTFSSNPVCLTTNNSVVTSISGQVISTVTTTAGRCALLIFY